MDVFDIALIIILVFGLLMGMKRGFTKQAVNLVGTIGSVIIAFIFKNQVSIILYENLPFFKFGGILKGVTALNILLYEAIAFILVLLVVLLVYRILLVITTLFERLLDATIVLGIPSKILGGILGVVEYYIIIFIALFILTLPVFSFNDYIMEHSKYADRVLMETPVLSNYTTDTIDIINEFANLKNKYKEDGTSMQFNKETIDLFLKYKVVTVESIDKLIEKDKIKIDAIEEILIKYRD